MSRFRLSLSGPRSPLLLAPKQTVSDWLSALTVPLKANQEHAPGDRVVCGMVQICESQENNLKRDAVQKLAAGRK